MSKIDNPKQIAAKTLAAQRTAAKRTPAAPASLKTAANDQSDEAAGGSAAVPAAKALPKTAEKPVRPVEVAREKARKVKLVRDSFTIPESEYELLGQIKKQCLKAGFEIKKSELLRIGVGLVSQMDVGNLQSLLGTLPKLKTGRPKKS